MLCWSQTQPEGLVCLSLVHISSAAPRTARGQEGALGPRALQGVLRTDPLQHVSLLQHSSSLGRILCPIFFFIFPVFLFQPEHVQSSPQRRAVIALSGWPSCAVFEEPWAPRQHPGGLPLLRVLQHWGSFTPSHGILQ